MTGKTPLPGILGYLYSEVNAGVYYELSNRRIARHLGHAERQFAESRFEQAMIERCVRDDIIPDLRVGVQKKMATALQTLETIDYAQKHPEVIPQECASRPLWQDRLSCWRSHNHQDSKAGPYISDFYGNEEVQKIWQDRDTSRLQKRKESLLGSVELRSSTDALIQDSYKKIQSFHPRSVWDRCTWVLRPSQEC